MNSTKQLKSGVVLSYLTLILSNIIALVYTPFMLRMMGQSEYGLYSLVASVVAYLTILDFGFGNAIIRYTAKYRAEEREGELSSLFGMFLAIYIVIGVIALIVGIGLYSHVDFLFGNSMNADELSKVRLMFFLMVVNVAITFPLSIFPSIIVAYEHFVYHKVVNLFRILLQPCLMIPLLLLGYKALGMVVLVTVLNVLSLLVYCWYCFARLKVSIVFSGFYRPLLKEISSYSFYVFLTIIVDRAFWSTGQFILGMLSGTEDVAIYALVVQLCNYYMTLSVAISGVFLPKMTRLVSERKGMKEISDLFIKIGRIQFIVLAYVLFGFVLFGKSFVSYWAGDGYEKVYPLTLMLMIPQTIPLIQNLGISVLQALNRQRFRSFLNFIVSVLSVFVSYLLTKKYGIVGCAVSTGCALLLGHGLILNWYYETKIQLAIMSFWKQIVRLSVPVVVAVVLTALVKYFWGTGNLWVLFTEGIVYTVLYFILLWYGGCDSFEKMQLITSWQKMKVKLVRY